VHRPETQSFNVELSDLDITEEDLVKVFLYLLEAKLFKAKDLADKDPDPCANWCLHYCSPVGDEAQRKCQVRGDPDDPWQSQSDSPET